MITPAQLITQLKDAGINRESRVLTDWRERGLLPPLRRQGRGRGKGSIYGWDEDVLEQAIATHWLLDRYGRADEALLGLWLSGFTISSDKVQKAWLKHLKNIQNRRQQTASQFRDNLLGLGLSWSRRLRKKSTSDKSILEPYLSFMRETLEWLYDDDERDDIAYQDLIVEILNRFDNPNQEPASKELYKIVSVVWSELEIPRLFRSNESIEFIKSVSKSEFEYTHKSLVLIREIIQHPLELQDTEAQEVIDPVGQVTFLMKDFIGPFITKVMILENRMLPNLPIAKSISAIHSFLNNVELGEISQTDDGTYTVSQGVRREWLKVRENLFQIWKATTEQIAN